MKPSEHLGEWRAGLIAAVASVAVMLTGAAVSATAVAAPAQGARGAGNSAGKGASPLSGHGMPPVFGRFVGQWPIAGQNLNNTRYQAGEDDISPGNVGSLSVRWKVKTAGDVLATPTVFDGSVYAPDNGGKLWAVEARTGRVEWSRSVSSYTGVEGDTSRSSPAVYGNELVLGDQWIFQKNASGAKVFAVNRHNGKRLWTTQVDSNNASIVTSSPTVYRGVVYVGVSSKDEPFAKKIAGFHSTFRGAVVALSAETGKILWKTYTVPSNNHNADSNRPGYYSGGAVWGSSPVVDPARGMVFVGTGNNYTVPSGVCTQPGQGGCQPPPAADHVDSILALNMKTGAVQWADGTLSSDSWTAACMQPTCGPDFDFGSAPNLFTTVNPQTGQAEQLLGIGQKSGIYWAVDPANGNVVWHTQVGPGGKTGGIEWGSATNGSVIYFSEADTSNMPYTLAGSGPWAGKTISSGSWGAMNAATGTILWQTPDPQEAWDIGYVTAANGVVYVSSTAPSGNNMYALDGYTGQILWRFGSGGAVMSGASIVDNSVYWGSGYYTSKSCQSKANPLGICIMSPKTASIGANNALYAFSPTERLPEEDQSGEARGVPEPHGYRSKHHGHHHG